MSFSCYILLLVLFQYDDVCFQKILNRAMVNMRGRDWPDIRCVRPDIRCPAGYSVSGRIFGVSGRKMPYFGFLRTYLKTKFNPKIWRRKKYSIIYASLYPVSSPSLIWDVQCAWRKMILLCPKNLQFFIALWCAYCG